jgi:hypothetical protein
MRNTELSRTHHSTAGEIAFLDGLGAFSVAGQRYTGKGGAAAEKRRHRLLMQYLLVAELRHDWGTVEKAKVIEHVHKMLKKGGAG